LRLYDIEIALFTVPIAKGDIEYIFDMITELKNFLLSYFSLRYLCNGLTGGECAYKCGAIPNGRRDSSAEPGQFSNDLPALEDPLIDSVRHHDHIWKSLSSSACNVDNLERSHRGLNVKPGRRTWRNYQTGDRHSRGERSLIRCRIDNEMAIACRDLKNLASPPPRTGLIVERYFVDRELQISGLSPFATGPLWIGVSKGGVTPASLQFGSNRNRKCGLADTTFALRYGNDVAHRLAAQGPASGVGLNVMWRNPIACCVKEWR
jgi:hypothetical protein